MWVRILSDKTAVIGCIYMNVLPKFVGIVVSGLLVPSDITPRWPLLHNYKSSKETLMSEKRATAQILTFIFVYQLIYFGGFQ